MLGVILGAGSVGRGFIGELFSDADMEICFVDVAEDVIENINNNHGYKHITAYNDQSQTKYISKASAISSLDENSVMDYVLKADIIATSLGANVLPIIAPVLAKSLLYRIDRTNKEINILICENLHNADQYMRELLLKNIPQARHVEFIQKVGLLATSIGRMIPAFSSDIREKDPATIIVEPYKILPFNGAEIRGILPKIPNLIWDDSVNFDFYSDRKLYIHNMGHCVMAYLAEYHDYEFIWQATYDSKVRYFVRSAMIESAIALEKKYDQDLSMIVTYIDNLLMRFANKATGDTCQRVGRDPVRKLKADDRLLGAYKLCIDEKVSCLHLTLGVAAGLLKLKKTEEFKFDNIKEYLLNEIPWLFSKEHEANRNLLMQQVSILKNGFNFKSQIDLINQASETNIL